MLEDKTEDFEKGAKCGPDPPEYKRRIKYATGG